MKKIKPSNYSYPSDTEKLILSLLKKDKEEAERLLDLGHIDSQRLLRLSYRHMVLPMVLHNLSTLKIKNETGDTILKENGDIITKAAAIHMQFRYELKLVSDIFEKSGIDFMLIKGFALDKSPMRQMSDIDLLIREEDLTQAFALLKDSGYHYTGSGVMSKKEIENPFKTLDWNNQFQFQSPKSHINIEVHTNLFERDRIRLENLDSLLDKTDLFRENRVWDEELNCYIPSKEASLALLCIHSTTKRSPAHNTYILRHGYDIASLLQSGADMEKLLFISKEWNIEYYIYTSLKMTGMILGKKEMQELAMQFRTGVDSKQLRLSKIQQKCFRGLGDASILYRKLYAILMPRAIGGSFKKALRWYREQIFPPFYVQESRYGINRKTPAIYFTYIYGPFLHALSLLRNRMHSS